MKAFRMDYKGYEIACGKTYRIYRGEELIHTAKSFPDAQRYVDGIATETEKEMKEDQAAFDTDVIKNIRDYIFKNDLSLSKIAKESGMDYYHLWSFLNRNQNIKLNDYIALCRAFREPLEKFIPEPK